MSRRGRKKLPTCEPVCVEDGGRGLLVTGKEIYPHREDLWKRAFYRCPCGAYVGCHAGTTEPLGKPAGDATRKARNAAHKAFDRLWRAKMAKESVGQHQARSAGYRWLAAQLGIVPSQCHIAWMDEATALRVVAICTPFHGARAAA